MITAEMEVETGILPEILSDDDEDYEYEYPPEMIDRWIRETDESEERIARGEIKPQSVRDVAAKYGVVLD